MAWARQKSQFKKVTKEFLIKLGNSYNKHQKKLVKKANNYQNHSLQKKNERTKSSSFSSKDEKKISYLLNQKMIIFLLFYSDLRFEKLITFY